MLALTRRFMLFALVLAAANGATRVAPAADHPALLPQDGKETWVFIGLNQAGEDWYLDVGRTLLLPNGFTAFTLKRGNGNHQDKVLYYVDCASGLANAVGIPPKKPLPGSALENAVLRVCRTSRDGSSSKTRENGIHVEIVDGIPMALIEGQIDRGFARKLKSVVRSQKVRAIVILSSPGGLVGEALDAGQFLHENELPTMAIGGCASACVYLFAGGVRRYALESTIFYLHRAKPSHGTGSSESGQALQALISEYLLDKGVSVVIANKAAQVANSDAVPISGRDAVRYGLVHDVTHP